MPNKAPNLQVVDPRASLRLAIARRQQAEADVAHAKGRAREAHERHLVALSAAERARTALVAATRTDNDERLKHLLGDAPPAPSTIALETELQDAERLAAEALADANLLSDEVARRENRLRMEGISVQEAVGELLSPRALALLGRMIALRTQAATIRATLFSFPPSSLP